MRKPRDVPMREFPARVSELNEYLAYFPPFYNKQSLPNEEFLDILEFAIPNTWQICMVLWGFDPLIHNVSEFDSNMNLLSELWIIPKKKDNLKSGSNDAKWHAKFSVEAVNKCKSTESSVTCIDVAQLSVKLCKDKFNI
jgi:hypothetical protein